MERSAERVTEVCLYGKEVGKAVPAECKWKHNPGLRSPECSLPFTALPRSRNNLLLHLWLHESQREREKTTILWVLLLIDY